MSDVLLIWQRVPVIIRAVLVGALVAALGTTPWAFLVKLNLKYATGIPWAVPVTAVYLWLYWQYMTGAWGPPRSNSGARKRNCRANALSDETWGAALLAGIAGLVFIVVFQAVFSRMVSLPKPSLNELSQVPGLTLFFSVVMSAIVAGVVEESAFRGYMQKPIEESHGPVVAILIVGLLFGFAHFTHPEVTLALMPYYLVVAAVYGMLAYLTNSIYPSLVLHAGGNLLSSLGLFMNGGIEERVSEKRVSLVWDTGVDVDFLMLGAATLLVGAITILAYRRLANVARKGGREAR